MKIEPLSPAWNMRCLIDRKLRVARAGKRYCDFFCASPNDLNGVSLLDYPLIPSWERGKVANVIETCIRTKMESITSNRAVWTDKDGQRRVVLMRWRNIPQLNDLGHVMGVMGYGQILREIKQTGNKHPEMEAIYGLDTGGRSPM